MVYSGAARKPWNQYSNDTQTSSVTSVFISSQADFNQQTAQYSLQQALMYLWGDLLQYFKLKWTNMNNKLLIY